MIKAEDRAKAVAKVEKLSKIAKELRQGKALSITRLTMLKSLCQDPVAAARFGLYLADRAKTKAPKRFRPLIDEGLAQLRRHLARPRAQAAEALWGALHALEQAQNQYEHQRWANVRIIYSKQALLAEYALRCAAHPWESAYWGYHLARVYAERYDSRYGTGLIPASASAVQDIAKFWSGYYEVKHGKRERHPPRG